MPLAEVIACLCASSNRWHSLVEEHIREAIVSSNIIRHEIAVILKVEAAAAACNGIIFYFGNQDIWLAEVIPGRFISVETG